MDRWRYYDITHRDHVVCNPTSLAKLDEIVGLLDLPTGPRVLDIACGKGEFLVRVAERWGGPGGAGFRGVGVDLSPYHLAELRASAARRVPAAQLEAHETGGADYPAEPGSFDLGSCIGASWIWNGLRGTLRALREAVRPGGLVLCGEEFWIREPDPEYLASTGMARDVCGSHAENVEIGVGEGLVPLLALVSNGDEWDRYETLQWRAAARFAAANPGDPDLPEILERIEKNRHEYLAWGRETLGWALYLFARP